jgi:hypothetical protein
MAGVPIIQVRQWMEHSTIAMTMRYAHLSPGAGADWIRMLEAPANQSSDDEQRAVLIGGRTCARSLATGGER